LSFGSDHMLRLWDWNTKKLIRIYAGHTNTVTSAVCSADGNWIYSCGAGERGVRRWPVDDRLAAGLKVAPKADLPRIVQESGRLSGLFSNLIALPASDKLIVGGSGIKIWDPAAGVSRSFPQKNFRSGPFTATLAPSPDGRKLFSASWGDADITV